MEMIRISRLQLFCSISKLIEGGRRCRDRMVVGFTTTCAIDASSNSTQGEVYNIM
jgi:hypothetical protein